MENAAKKNDPGPKRKKGETLKEKIHRHLQDKNDIITEEDIRDVKVGKDAIADIEKQSKEMAKEVAREKNITPWDILDEE